MAKKTYQSTDGTSFQGVVIRATVNQLISAFGDPSMEYNTCLLYTSPSPRDRQKSRMPSSA